MINLVSFKSSLTNEASYLDDLFETLGELILEMRYDVKELEKKSTYKIKKTSFNIFLNNQYKIKKSINSQDFNNKSLSINFYLQKKENGFSLQAESWNFYLIKAKIDGYEPELSNLSRAKICLLLRSVLCLLTSLPLWSNFILLNDKNINKKQYFLDHELLVNSKEKEISSMDQKSYKEVFHEIETENFMLILKISYLIDYSFFSNNINNKVKIKNDKLKRERFLSEGTFEENEKIDAPPLRFFAQWGIEGDISHKKVPNHFKINHKSLEKFENEKTEIMSNPIENSQKNSDNYKEEIELEVIDSEQDIPIQAKKWNFDDDDDNNQFELITEETLFDKKVELKKHNSDYQIIGGDINQKNNETLEKIIEKCKSCLKKIVFFESKVPVDENFIDLRVFLKTLD